MQESRSELAQWCTHIFYVKKNIFWIHISEREYQNYDVNTAYRCGILTKWHMKGSEQCCHWFYISLVERKMYFCVVRSQDLNKHAVTLVMLCLYVLFVFSGLGQYRENVVLLCWTCFIEVSVCGLVSQGGLRRSLSGTVNGLAISIRLHHWNIILSDLCKCNMYVHYMNKYVVKGVICKMNFDLKIKKTFICRSQRTCSFPVWRELLSLSGTVCLSWAHLHTVTPPVIPGCQTVPFLRFFWSCPCCRFCHQLAALFPWMGIATILRERVWPSEWVWVLVT